MVMAGDFNARVGNLLESASAGARGCMDATVTAHGRQLIGLYRDTGSLLCTGRTPGNEQAFYSLKPAVNLPGSRVDHVIIPEASFPVLTRCVSCTHRPESEHYPLEGVIILSVSHQQQRVLACCC